MRDYIECCAPSVIFIFFVFFIVIAVASAITFNACGNYYRITGKETIYAWFDSCYVKHDERFYRWDEYKALVKQLNITKEGDL